MQPQLKTRPVLIDSRWGRVESAPHCGKYIRNTIKYFANDFAEKLLTNENERIMILNNLIGEVFDRQICLTGLFRAHKYIGGARMPQGNVAHNKEVVNNDY